MYFKNEIGQQAVAQLTIFQFNKRIKHYEK